MSFVRRTAVSASLAVAVSGAALVAPGVAAADPVPGAVSAAGGIVVNASFEKPAVASGTYRYTKSIPGWKARTGTIEVDNNAFGPAADGNQYVELDAKKVSSIEQIVTLPSATQRYAVVFRYSGRPGHSADENSFLVQLNGTIVPFSLDTTRDSTLTWRSGQVVFVAGSTQGTLRFIGQGPSDGLGAFIDAVSITPIVG